MAGVEVRRGMPGTQLTKDEFARRVRGRFYDPAFDRLGPEIEQIIDAAWDAYDHSRKSPRTRPAGPEFADPSYELSVEWLNTRQEIRTAEHAQKDAKSPSRILIVNGSSRSDQTCPGEMSKTYRLISRDCSARQAFSNQWRRFSQPLASWSMTSLCLNGPTARWLSDLSQSRTMRELNWRLTMVSAVGTRRELCLRSSFQSRIMMAIRRSPSKLRSYSSRTESGIPTVIAGTTRGLMRSLSVPLA